MLRFAKTILTLGVLAFAVPAAAAIQIFDFVARIDTPDSPYGTGTVFTGSFSYDDALVPTSTFRYDPAEGDAYRQDTAEYRSPGITLNFELGGRNFSGGGFAYVSDMIDEGLEDGDGFAIGNYDDPHYFFDLVFYARNATTFLDTRLPASFPAGLWQGPFADPSDDDELTIPHGELGIYDRERQFGFSALVLSITPAGAVPEPSTWAMLILGFGAIGGMLRGRRRSTGALTFAA